MVENFFYNTSKRITMNISEAEESEKEKEIELQEESMASGEELVKGAYSEAEQKLIKFVQQNIELMKQKLLTVKMPTLTDVNTNLLQWAGESFSLNTLYQRSKYDADRVKKELQAFEDQALMDVKREYNRDDNKKVWYSNTELQAAAHTKYKAKFAKLNAKLAVAEGRYSFMKHLMETWGSYQFALGTVSKNLQAEAYANGSNYKAQNYLPPDSDDNAVEKLAQQAMQLGSVNRE